MENKKIGIIGFGNMGSAIYDILKYEYDVRFIFACDTSQKKLKGIPSANSFMDSSSLVSKVDIVILAIKPQDFDDFAQECINNNDLENKLIISIMAGKSLESLSNQLETKNVIRAMPNIALQYKKSVTGWIPHEDIHIPFIKLAHTIMNLFGTALQVEDEEDIDKITALSGSGPAYFLLFLEILAQSAEEFGFDNYNSRRIAQDTMLSALTLSQRNPQESFENLRDKITSKGGTTETAIKHMESKKLRKTFQDAIKKAFKKSKKLNKTNE
jgi:pyrroline-5-carboxylate reductase